MGPVFAWMLCVAISGAKIAMRMMSATTISPMMACGWLRSVVEMNPRRPGVRSGDPSTAISSLDHLGGWRDMAHVVTRGSSLK